MKYLFTKSMAIIVVLIGLFAFNDLDHSVPNINPIKAADLIKVASPYGMRTHPITHEQKLHTGIDIIAELGVPVMATADGKVFSVEFNDTGYGNKVVIEHTDNIKTLYAQLNEISVKEGQKVKQRQIIGSVGSSGTSTGPHLHYEILENDKPVNPESYLSN